MLPPGLSPGWHSVRLRVAGSAWSNPHRIAVDIPQTVADLAIEKVTDGVTWEIGSFSLSHGFFSLWISGLPDSADVNNLLVELDDRRQRVTFVGQSEGGVRQINVKAAPNTLAGSHALSVSFGDARAQSVEMAARP